MFIEHLKETAIEAEEASQKYLEKFKGKKWRNEINVADFIENNYKEYKGDDSFRKGKSQKTAKGNCIIKNM